MKRLTIFIVLVFVSFSLLTIAATMAPSSLAASSTNTPTPSKTLLPSKTPLPTKTPLPSKTPTLTKTPTPTPILTWTPVVGVKLITLKADGKGDYPDLPAAVAAAPEGAVIVLEKGN